MVIFNQKLISIDYSKLDMTEAYLGHNPTSVMDVFYKNS